MSAVSHDSCFGLESLKPTQTELFEDENMTRVSAIEFGGVRKNIYQNLDRAETCLTGLHDRAKVLDGYIPADNGDPPRYVAIGPYYMQHSDSSYRWALQVEGWSKIKIAAIPTKDRIDYSFQKSVVQPDGSKKLQAMDVEEVSYCAELLARIAGNFVEELPSKKKAGSRCRQGKLSKHLGIAGFKGMLG